MTPIFDIVVPEVSVPLGLGIITSSMGISFDQLINGDTYEERRSAIQFGDKCSIAWSVFCNSTLISKAGINQRYLAAL